MSLLAFGHFVIRGADSTNFNENRLSSYSPTISTTQDKRPIAEIKVVDFQENHGCYTLKLISNESSLITIDYSTLLKTKEFWESLLRKSDYTYKACLFLSIGIAGWRTWAKMTNQSLTPLNNVVSIAAALSSLVFAVFVIYRSQDINLNPFPRVIKQLAHTFNTYRRELFANGLQTIRNIQSDSITQISDSLLTTKEKEFVIRQYFTNNASIILSDLTETTYQTWFDQNISPILDVIFKKEGNRFGLKVELFGKDEPALDRQEAFEQICQKAMKKSLANALTYSELVARVNYQMYLFVPHLKAQMKTIFDSMPGDTIEAKEWLTGEINNITTNLWVKKLLVKALQLENLAEPSPLNDSFL